MKESKNFYSRYRIVVSKIMGHFYKLGVSLMLLMFLIPLHVGASDILFLKAEKITISSVFDKIEELSDYTIFYKTEDINLTKTVNVDFKNENVFKAIDAVLKHTNLTYTVNGKVIVIHAKNIEITKSDVSMQLVKVKGKVTGEDSQAIPGVSVLEKGTTNGAVTALDGSYEIECTMENPILVFSFMGMISEEVLVGSQSEINIILIEDNYGLEEIVVVGYGTQRKSVVTGSISNIDAEDITQTDAASVDMALTGRMAGVVVTPTTGQPGSAGQISIRGVGTNGNSDPLIIVDGLQISDLNYVNPSDIESVEVLKDATSAAIYGSRAANGVILITTKKGELGKSSLSYNGSWGIQSAINVPEMLSASQYVQLMREFANNDGTEYIKGIPTEPTGHDVDWFSEIIKPAPVQEHNLTATVSNQKGAAFLSLGHRNQEGIIGGDIGKSFFKRYSARLNSNYNIIDAIRIGANVNFTHIHDNALDQGTNGSNAVYYAMLMDPTTPVRDADSPDDRGWGVTTVPYTRMWNPRLFMDVTANNRRAKDRLYGNTYAEFNILKGLSFKTDLGVDIYNYNFRAYSPTYQHGTVAASSNRSVRSNSERTFQWQWENTLIYNKSIDRHEFTLLAGTTALSYQREVFDARRNGLRIEAQENEDLWYLDNGDIATVSNTGIGNPDHRLFSYFGRAHYNYDERYMAELIIRRDGSSRFGPENRFAVFPGISAGWNIAKESFWTIDAVNHLKLRGSWGQIGNERILDLQYAALIQSDRNYILGADKKVIVGSSPANIYNPKIVWETGEQLNFGLDFGFYQNKLTGALDYFNKTTKDLLFLPTLESLRGNESAVINSGEVKNTGVEFELNYSNVVGEFKYSIGGNVTYLKNIVTDVANKNGYEEGAKWRESTIITRMEEDFPIGYIYGYKTDGIFQNAAEVQQYAKNGIPIQPDAVPGDFKWKDLDGNGKIDEEDKTMIGQPWPKFTYGINLSAEYKGFDMAMLFTGKAGYQIYSAQTRAESFGRSNLPAFYYDRWTKEGDNNGIPRLSTADPNENFTKPSDFYVYDGNFFRISMINIGYTVPKDFSQKLKMEKLRVYVAVNNLLTITKYPYFNPEIGPMKRREDSRGGGVDIVSTGLDYGMYPLARTIRFGVNVQF